MASLCVALLLLRSSALAHVCSNKIHGVPMLFQFGDSLSDTGNAIAAFPQFYKHLGLPPYGSTFFRHPSGRSSDGRLLVDFIAMRLGLPLLEPYLLAGSDNEASYHHGADFSVCAGPAMSLDFFAQHNYTVFPPTFALDTQLEWFRDFQKKQGNCTRPRTRHKKFSRGLYIVGEVGGNDYFKLHANNVSLGQLQDYVAFVVKAVSDHVRGLYSAGARRFLVVNMPLAGCTAGAIASATGNDMRDEFGCLAEWNSVISHHNSLLEAEVHRLRKDLTRSSISYGDFQGFNTAVLKDPKKYGFEYPFLACCGNYTNNLNSTVRCSETRIINGETVNGQICADPAKHIFWDDGHFTERFNLLLADAFFSHGYTDPPIR